MPVADLFRWLQSDVCVALQQLGLHVQPKRRRLPHHPERTHRPSSVQGLDALDLGLHVGREPLPLSSHRGAGATVRRCPLAWHWEITVTREMGCVSVV